MMDLLLWVYDLDSDGSLSDLELESVFSDFSERCESIHSRLLEDFDADGDGELSEEEMELAHHTLRERRDSKREERAGRSEQEREQHGAEGRHGPPSERDGLPPFD